MDWTVQRDGEWVRFMGEECWRKRKREREVGREVGEREVWEI